MLHAYWYLRCETVMCSSCVVRVCMLHAYMDRASKRALNEYKQTRVLSLVHSIEGREGKVFCAL